MLADATVAIARESDAVTVLARGAKSFVRASGLTNAMGVDVDWRDAEAFASVLKEQAAVVGAFDLALVWIHSSASDAFYALLDVLSFANCEVVHVVGSLDAASRLRPECVRQYLASKALGYRVVRLGSKADGGRRRWLTHDEISSGVLQCVRGSQDLIVGELRSA